MIGSLLSHFEITRELGRGGMGVVYRAIDTRLGREVAIKVLPAELAAEEARLARFQREARLLARLSHPNIAAIYEVGEADLRDRGSRTTKHHFLVMELAEGETLAKRLLRGALPIADALAVALRIAEGLEAAHEKGVVHRDLKPANVMIGDGGKVKILDFGLARAWAGELGAADASISPTLTAELTEAGAVFGTAAYMSPEQANGETADKRADIWSFGVLVAEMLSGERLFTGPTFTATLAAVLRDPISLEGVPADTPPPAKRLLARCLERDRERRLRDIGEARIALESARSTGEVSPLVVAASRGGTGASSRRGWALAALSAAALIAVAFLISPWLRSGRVDPPVLRSNVPLPSALQLWIGDTAYPMALSPDGQRLAYVASAGEEPSIFVRDLGDFVTRPIAATEGARYPFFSPDGEWIGFFSEGRLRKVAVGGEGAPLELCAAAPTRGAAWSANGFVYFADREGGLLRVSESGGKSEKVTTDQPDIDARVHYFPYALPDGSGLITHPREPEGSAEPDRLALLDFELDAWRFLSPGTQAQYVESGFLVVHAGRGELHAAPFDLASRELRGEPLPVLSGVYRAPNFGGAFFAVSPGGTLAFLPGGFDRELKRVSRAGEETSLVDEVRGFRMPRLSPDGQKLAIVVDPRPSELWVYDLETGARSRIADTGHNLVPVWAPDAAALTYTSRDDLHRAPADGSRLGQPLLEIPGAQYAGSWSPDEQILVYWDLAGDSTDIWVLEADGSRRPILATAAHAWNARLSPDGRWLAYQSDESGRLEVYVSSFPDGEGRWPVSTGGGSYPAWSADGSELFYDDGESIYAVAVRAGGALDLDPPTRLFDWPDGLVHHYDVFPDGQSFVIVKTDPDAGPDSFRVVLNWSRELEERFSGGG